MWKVSGGKKKTKNHNGLILVQVYIQCLPSLGKLAFVNLYDCDWKSCHTTITHNNTMSRRHPTLQRLCPLTPCIVGQWHPQVLAPWLPMGPQQVPGGGSRLPRLVSFLGAPKRDQLKNRERDGILALGGHRLDVKHDNQPRVCISGGGIIIGEAQLQRNVWEERRIIISGWQIEPQNSKN